MAAAVLTVAGSFALAAVSAPTAPAGGDADAPPMHVKGGSGLTFQIDVLGTGSVADLPVFGPIMFDPFGGPPLFSVELAADVLCVQNGAQQGVQLELTDTNGRMSVFDGLAGIHYFPSSAAPVQGLTLKVATDANPRCAEVPTIAQTVTTDASPVECAASDLLFGNGFENAGSGGGSGPNLQVDFRLISHPNTSNGDPAEYEIHVTNCGDAAASQVGVRDIFPTSMALPPKLLQGGPWQCVAGASCSGTEYVNHVFSQLLPGASRVIRATRQLESGTAGEMIRVSAAAMSLSSTPDVQPSFNSGSWEFEIRSNDPPTASVTGTADSLAEDDGTVRVTGVTIAAADTDGSIVSVAVNSLSTSILTIASVDDTDPANVLVDVTTVADAFGTATLEVIATDDLSGNSQAVTFDVVVDPINDPPTITVKGGFDYNGGVPTFAGNCTEASATGCADQAYPSNVGIFDANFINWVVQVSPGPANESSQTAMVGIGAPSDPALFLGASFEPELIDLGGSWSLDYGLSGDSGTATLVITVDDGELINNQTTLSFDIFIDNGPPSVTAGQSFEIDENSSGSVGTLVGTDPETDPLSDWAIVGGNTDVDADTNLPFAINPATGEITVNDADDLDFEDTPSFTLSVTVGDGSSTSAPENVTIDLNDVNDTAPVVDSGQAFQVIENTATCQSPGFGSCVVTATDVDTVGSLQGWAIASGNVSVDGDGNAPFAINPSTGLISVNDQGDMDYELMPSFSLMVTVGDGVNTSAQQLVTINLLNINDNAPSVDSGQVLTVDENTAATTFVGTVTGTDPDNDPLQDWAITGGNDDVDMDTNPAFAIDPASGAITVNDADDLDFETQSQFNLQVVVGDGVNLSAAETVTIDLNDVSEPQ